MTGPRTFIIKHWKILALMLTIATPQLATADGYQSRHGDRSAHQLIERQADVNLRVRNERLPIRRILEIGPKFEGASLQAVEIELRPRGRNTRFLLLADGDVVGEAWSHRGGSYVRLVPWQRLKIDRNVNRLQVAVEGSARIRGLSATFKSHHGRGQRHWQRNSRHSEGRDRKPSKDVRIGYSFSTRW